jgi:hypothetical protein
MVSGPLRLRNPEPCGELAWLERDGLTPIRRHGPAGTRSGASKLLLLLRQVVNLI